MKTEKYIVRKVAAFEDNSEPRKQTMEEKERLTVGFNFKSVILTIFTGFSLLYFSGCSSSPSSETDEIEESMKQEAGTDAAPQDGIEIASASANAPSENQNSTTENVENAPDPFQTEKKSTDRSDQDEKRSMASTSSEENDDSSGGPKEKYTIQTGDTLMKIAFDTYGDLYKWKKIFRQNKSRIKDPNALPSGLTLFIEKPSQDVVIDRNGEKYLIKMGDTLGTISYDVYGSKSQWKRIWENNRQLIRDPNKIFAGFYLYYLINNEERQEAERLKQSTVKQTPLAGLTPGASGTISERLPASKSNPPVPVAPVPPGAVPGEKKN